MAGSARVDVGALKSDYLVGCPPYIFFRYDETHQTT